MHWSEGRRIQMRDLNFFESYIAKRDRAIYGKGICYLLTFVLLLFIIIYTLLNQIKIRQISKEIVKLESIIDNEGINNRIADIEEKKKEVKEFDAYLEKYRLLDKIIEEDGIIDDYLLESIVSRTPEGIYFTSITMNLKRVELIGVSEEQYSIAAFGKSLESIEDFKEVFISSISKDDNYYSFLIKIKLKDVSSDGENEIFEEENIEAEDDKN